MLNRSKVWAAVLLLAAFGAGGAVGGAMWSAWGWGDGQPDRGRGGRDRGQRMGYSDRLQSALDLSEAQRATVDSILDQRQVEMEAMWEEIRPRYDTLRERIRGQIMQVLDAEQQERYRELITQSRRRGEGEREREQRDH